MIEKRSYRLVEQGVRNSIMDLVEALARGDDRVREVGPDEYFESFFDLIPHGSTTVLTLTTLNETEKSKLLSLARFLDDACDATPKIMTADELIATGWPSRIQLIARETLDLFIKRGRFNKEKEEEEPSSGGQST